MTILRHPSLPEVEPKPLRFTFGCKFVAESFPSLPRITGPLGDDEEDAAQKWNDWVRPLVELQAQHDRWLQLSKDYGERVESLEDDVSALTAERDKLDADLTAANARAERCKEALRACEPFLKEGETPAECIERNRTDPQRPCLMCKFLADFDRAGGGA